MSNNIHMLIIDPQHDFCNPSGTLFVPGSQEDMDNLGEFIVNRVNLISKIHVTLDNHHLLDIAHPLMWADSEIKHPPPFTIITSKDIEDGKWHPVVPGSYQKALQYVKDLEEGGRYPLCIWPPHCLIGSLGATVVPQVNWALGVWSDMKVDVVDYITKGQNIWTEHYSAIRAEVVDPDDDSTNFNEELFDSLLGADEILVAGEAGSHCVANTVRDLVSAFGGQAKKITLLTNAVSPVPGFEKLQEDFISEMVVKGMKCKETFDVFKD